MLKIMSLDQSLQEWSLTWNVYGGCSKTGLNTISDGVFAIYGVDLGGVEKISSKSVTINFSPVDAHVNLNRKGVPLPFKNGRKFLSSNHFEILATPPQIESSDHGSGIKIFSRETLGGAAIDM